MKTKKQRFVKWINKFLGRVGIQIHLTDEAFADQHELLLRRGEMPRVILDVGASIGTTLSTYKKYFPDTKVYSFEPFPASFQQLAQRAAQYREAYPIQKALAATKGQSFLNSNALSDTNSILPPSKTDSFLDNWTTSKEQIAIETTTLDDFMAENNIEYIDLLKLDVQGYALEVFKGAEKALRERRIGLIYTEIDFLHLYQGEPLYHELRAFLEEKGYALFGIYNLSRLDSRQLAWGDAIFYDQAQASTYLSHSSKI